MLEPHRRNLEIPIPYMLSQQDLVLDSAAINSLLPDQLDFIMENIHLPSVLERVFRSTTLLFHSSQNNGTLGECLHTAIIWEVG
jgi:hypothetical protein